MKEQIFKSTIKLVNQEGIHNSPMSKIARLANISPGSIYNYFESKSELISSLYMRLIEERSKHLKTDQDSDIDYKSRFFLMWLNLFKYYTKASSNYLFIRQIEHSPFLKKEIVKLIDDDPWKALVKEGLEIEKLKNLPEQLIIDLIYNSVSALVDLFLEEGEQLNNQILNSTLEYCWGGLSVNE
ncbi:MAG: TetR/AcrR family transcriptional regulator [Bacteroidota bacterium]